MRKENPEVDRQLVKHLRSRADMTQDAFGRAAGVDQRDVSRYELGHETPTEEVLRRMATAAGLPWPVVVSLRRIFAAAQSAVARAKSITRLASTAAIEETILDSVLLAVTPYLVEEMMAEPDRPTPQEALREADEIWTALAGFPPERRRRLIELLPRPAGNVALARRICEASAEEATRSAAEVAELADLALFTALRVPEGGGRRARAEGFCLGFVANAHRVATDFEAADTALAQAWSLWRAGEPAEPELLPEWRLHALEASLRREQRRFPEALECLARALALCGGQPAAVRHILLKKEHLFDAMGDAEQALAALEEAAPS